MRHTRGWRFGIISAMYEGTVFGKLDQKLQHAIHDAGYEKPTPIQEKAMP